MGEDVERVWLGVGMRRSNQPTTREKRESIFRLYLLVYARPSNTFMYVLFRFFPPYLGNLCVFLCMCVVMGFPNRSTLQKRSGTISQLSFEVFVGEKTGASLCQFEGL